MFHPHVTYKDIDLRSMSCQPCTWKCWIPSWKKKSKKPITIKGFPGGTSGKESACQCKRHKRPLGQEDSPGEGQGTPLQYSCLENPMDRRAWQATVDKFLTQTQLKWVSTHIQPLKPGLRPLRTETHPGASAAHSTHADQAKTKIF